MMGAQKRILVPSLDETGPLGICYIMLLGLVVTWPLE